MDSVGSIAPTMSYGGFEYGGGGFGDMGGGGEMPVRKL